MEISLSYFLNVAIAITVFYLAYYLLFSKEKMFTFNRYYLIISMFISFIIPLLTFTERIVASETIVTVQPEQVFIPALPISDDLNLHRILKIFFLSGFAFFLITFIVGHIKVWMIVKKSSKKSLNGHSVWITNKDVPPFAYFGKLIISSNILDNTHLQSVIHHEQTHIKGQHCLDLFLSEVLFLFQWFNPFAWFMKSAVRDNIEFLTDDKVTGRIDKQEYQLGMVSLASKTTFYTFPSISNQSQLKKRIIMMKNNKPNRFQWIRPLAIIPILAFLTITLSGREIKIINPASDIQITDNKHIAPPDTNTVIDNTKNSSLSGNFTLNLNDTHKPMYIIDGKEYAPGESDLSKLDPDDIESVSVLKNESALEAYGEKGRNGVVIIKTKKNVGLSNSSALNISTLNLNKTSEPMLIIDGKKYAPGEYDLSKLNPDDIESVSVLKNQSTLEVYGEDGKNGVVIITTKKKNSELSEKNKLSYQKKVNLKITL